jgi:hypothetical protein
MGRDRRTAPIGVILAMAAVVALGSVLVACSDDAGSDEAATTPSTTVATTTTTSPDGSGGAPVDPASLPDGWAPVRAEGVGVGLAVPGHWRVEELDAEQVADRGASLAEVDPQLAGMIEQAGALVAGGRVVLAADAEGGGTELASVVQLDLSLPTVPESFVAQVRRQVEAIGGEDVMAERVALPGLREPARALRVEATLPLGADRARLLIVVVPTDIGLAIVSIRSEAPELAGRIAATIATA